MIWKCEDCNKIGFYFPDISTETIAEFRARHQNECHANETLGDWAAHTNFSGFVSYWEKKLWVPEWLWSLFAKRCFKDEKVPK